jgi:hypothetical protein
MSHPSKTRDFIKTLEKEVKRLSPTLNLSMTSLDPYSQIIYIVRVAIDTLIDERKSIESEYLKVSHESCPHSASSDQAELLQAKSKLIDAQNQLKKFERLVRQKEKKIEEREKELESITFNVKGKSFPDEIIQKNKEIETRIKALIVKEEEVKNNADQLERERKHFEGEKLAVFHMKGQISANLQESEKNMENSRRNLEGIEKEKEKIAFEAKILLEKEEALRLKQEYIEKTMGDLDKRKKALEDEKTKFRIERTSLGKVMKEEKSLDDDRKFTFGECRSQTSRTLPETPERLQNKEMDGLFNRLREQMEVYNQEVSIRETILNEKQKKIKQTEEKMKKNLQIYQDYEKIIIRVKNEINEFRAVILEEFETMFKRMKVQLELLTRKTSEVDKLNSKISDSIFLKSPNF